MPTFRRMTIVAVVTVLCLGLISPVSRAESATTVDPSIVEALQQQIIQLTAEVVDLRRQVSWDASRVYEIAKPSVVGVLVDLKDGKVSSGTGVISYTPVDHKEAQIVTNYHVVDGFDRISVILSDGRMFTAQFWAYDADMDLCWLKIEGTDLPPAIVWGDPAKVKVGEPVVAIGNPLGYRDSISVGVLSGRGRNLDHNGYEFLQTDAAVNSGNSGGPLLNKDGQWIGVVTVKQVGTGVEGLAFAYSLDAVKASININNNMGSTRAYLGAGLWETPAVSMGVRSDNGLVIVKLDPAGPLKQAGLREWDEILKVDEVKVSALSDVRRIVDSTKQGTKVLITYKRSGMISTVPVTLGGVAINMRKPILQSYAPILDSEGAF